MSEQPSLTYGGENDPNSGFAGSDTSEARARSEDESGVTGRRQREVMRRMAEAGTRGMTWKELAEAMNLHHGQASSALSNLHRSAHLMRLTETRHRCKVYVHFQCVDGRATEPGGVTNTTLMLEEMASVLTRFILHAQRTGHGHRAADPVAGCLACDAYNVLRRYEARR